MTHINVTPAAATKIAEILSDEPLGTKLRVYVHGGGCAGFQYGFTLELDVADDDIVERHGSADVVLDVMSLQYLTGATIDFVDDLAGSMFKIINPNAASTCGCGSSFTTKE